MNALHIARKAFIQAEASEKLRRALIAKTRTSTSLIFENGASVYYKRDGMPAWKGPGTVIGREGQTVLVKHGGTYVRVHPCRLKLENEEFAADEKHDKQCDSSRSEKNETQNTEEQVPVEEAEDTDSSEEENVDEVGRQDDIHETVVKNRVPVSLPVHSQENTEASVNKNKLPKLKSTVRAKMNDSEEWTRYEIL